ncbi:MAG: DEAD/DEAH box helicase, partial [Anaerohalosphaera sp.]|nr:DEAD/DEAH box helicase [Anaerohalosphaera sp.]
DLIETAKEKKVLLYCENSAEVSRVKEIVLESHGHLPANLKLPLGFVQRGFIVNSLNTVVVCHHEMFGQYAVRRRVRTVRGVSPVESLIDLNKGDYVVHLTYGIGKFTGIRTMEKGKSVTEYLTIEYADKILIHVPVSNIALVQKYIGAMPTRPKLSKVGSKKWENQKARVAKGVQELAMELLELQAQRESLGGVAFGDDTLWQKEFEESFLYQETVDQLRAAEEIKDDMKQARPMDRLICGDVGYGKTELAMRAAFKAVAGGKQVAVLVPTTVLCEQHGRTFTERFADFPMTIEVLNRFVTPKRANEVIAGAKRGSVDIVIGTHRLLSEDMGFKDLGLLVIDEEQRFGVEHKERLKRYRVNVDVLTMTATPIPRTLHMSMIGLRDISSLTTAPLDRRSIVTKVSRWDKQLIRRVIMHEINREGQVFFVYNRVQTIVRAAEELRKTINDDKVNIDIGHGQMTKRELEKAMLNFIRGKTDVLVCSTIIESGLDIPNANTMIVCEADRFGLAQLHQLRGRVGRYKHRAYAYMLLPSNRPVSPIAAKRLKAIEEYSQLGAGFRIALR